MSLGRTFWDLLRQRGQETALIESGEGPSGLDHQPVPASTLQARAIRLALGLQSLGLGPGQRVLLACPPSCEAMLLAIGAWMTGAVTVHLEPGLSETAMAESISRSKAGWMVVDRLRTVAALTAVADATVKEAKIILTDEEPPETPAVHTYEAVLKEGLGHQDKISALARTLFQIPVESRAAILYWETQEVKAVALTHEELIGALSPLPKRWGMESGESVLINMEMGGRNGLLATLRCLKHGLALVFAPDQSRVMETAAAVGPRILVMDPEDLDTLLENVDLAVNDTAVRKTLKKGLGWIDRQHRRRHEGASSQAVTRLDGWLERDLADVLVKSLGGRFSIYWSPDAALGDDTRALLEAAEIEIMEGN